MSEITNAEAIEKVAEERKPLTPEQVFVKEIKAAHSAFRNDMANASFQYGMPDVPLMKDFMKKVENALRKYNA